MNRYRATIWSDDRKQFRTDYVRATTRGEAASLIRQRHRCYIENIDLEYLGQSPKTPREHHRDTLASDPAWFKKQFPNGEPPFRIRPLFASSPGGESDGC